MDYAVLDAEGNCVNKIVWDGSSAWQPPEGCTVVADPNCIYCVPDQEPIAQPDDPLESLSYEQKQALIALLNNE